MENGKKIGGCMWEILVPVEDNHGTAFELSHHQAWDERVRGITGGLTILRTAKGHWVDMKEGVFMERMIPVRVIATREEIDIVIDITMEHYDQMAVLAYKVSEEFVLKHRKQ